MRLRSITRHSSRYVYRMRYVSGRTARFPDRCPSFLRRSVLYPLSNRIQMSQQLLRRFLRLKVDLPRLPASKSAQILTLWRELHESFVAESDNPAGLWSTIMQNNLIPGIMDLVPRTISLDSVGKASTYAVQVLANHCLAAGQAALARAPEDQETITTLRMAADSAWVTGIVKQWWIKFRHLAPQWNRDGDLEVWCEGFVFLLQSGVKTPIPGIDIQEYQTRLVRNGSEVQDFLLVWGVFGHKDQKDDPLRQFAFNTVILSKSLSPVPDHWAILPLLEAQPDTLAKCMKTYVQSRKDDLSFRRANRLLRWLRDSSSFRELLHVEDLPYAIARVYWTSFRDWSPEIQGVVVTDAFTIICELSRDMDTVTGRIQLGRLITDFDLLAMAEKVMLSKINDSATLQQQIAFWQSIANWLIANPDALRPVLHNDFLPILDHLRRAPDTPGNTAMRQFWMGLAIAVGFSEPGMRAELEWTRREARRNFIGCSWVKCPMYEQESVSETFKCTGCHRKLYCTLQCQKRDWEEGGHKTQCDAVKNGV